MYREYKRGMTEVGDALQRSLTNLTVAMGRRTNDDEQDENDAITKHVQECWSEVEKQCDAHVRATVPEQMEPVDGRWRTVRVFASSTFTDFFCERELLVKQVFPELRRWCRERKLYLVDCDLRWGIPSDATTSFTIATCLDELERCAQETRGKPFFLNMLGEKYGWCPGDSDLPNNSKQKYGWVEGTSITFMEILNGAYRIQNENALFMLRDDSATSDVPERLKSRYVSTDPKEKTHLKKLKSSLRTRFPNQVQDYKGTAEGTITQHGKEIVKITNLDAFGEHVLKFFKAVIGRMFPGREALPVTSSSVLEEDAQQQSYMEEQADCRVGRQAEYQTILAFLDGDTASLQRGEKVEPFSRSAEIWGEFMSFDNRLLCVQGEPGYGKTTLLAAAAQHQAQRGSRVFYHFCGGTGESHREDLLLQRLVAFLDNDNSADHLEKLSEKSVSDLTEDLKQRLLSLRSTPTSGTVTLILDGLDHLNTNLVYHLRWLPPGFPPCVRCIVSTGNHPVTMNRVQEHPHYSLVLGDLQASDTRDIVQTFLSQFNKILEPSQLQMILDSKAAHNPLWLYFICEELRIYGDFRTLTSHVETVTSSVKSMLEFIINRLVTEDKTGNIKKTLCIMVTSFGTITTLDMRRMLGDITTQEPLPMFHWSRIQTALQAYLKIARYNETLTFVHNQMREAVCDILMTEASRKLEYHRLLSDYLERWCEDARLRADHLPNHLLTAGLKQRLVNFLRTSPDSKFMPPFKRSHYFMKCRCVKLADPVINGVGNVTICQFCRLKPAKFHPNTFHRNEAMCIVCGNQIFGVTSSPGHVCQFHNLIVPKNSIRCFLCNNVTVGQGSVDGKLCTNCSFGHGAKQCAMLDIK